MIWFKNLKVKNKLLLSFTLIIFLAACTGTYIISSMVSAIGSYGATLDITGERIGHIFASKDHFTKARMLMREIYYPETTRDELNRLSGEIGARLDGLSEQLIELREVAESAVREKIQLVLPLVETYRSDAEYVIGLLLAVDEISVSNPKYRAAMILAEQKTAEMRKSYADNMAEAIDSFPGIALNTLLTQGAENGARGNSTFFISIGLFAAVATVSICIALWVPGLLSKPLIPLAAFMKNAGSTGDIALSQVDVDTIGKYSHVRDEIGQTISGASSFIKHVTNISEELKAVAEGDLTVEITQLSEDDTMAISIKNMIGNLNGMFGEIRTTTDHVSEGSKQVAVGAQSLAQGATEQAASIQQLSSAIAEVARRTRENADTAEETAKLSSRIKDSAEKGSRQMDEMILAVREINDASHSISKIIKTIDDIAFQTNILALNAAVEAARAGQHGKGFAVVAEEVRNLAAKSAQAAKETGDMIQNSMEKAEFGSSIAGNTALSLTEIVSGINESSQLVAEIAKSSEDQKLGISQINIGIDQVAQVIQQNSATAEESAAASAEMSNQANTLEGLLKLFTLKRAVIGNPAQLTNLLPPRSAEKAVEKRGGLNSNFTTGNCVF